MKLTTFNGITEAINADAEIGKVLISESRKDKRVQQLKELCREKGVVFQFSPQSSIDRKSGGENQGVYAEVAPVKFRYIEEITGDPDASLVIILDNITDTGNFGAIVRTAVAAGVDGIITPARRSAPVNETVFKTSAGTLAYAPVIVSKSIAHDIESLKKSGFWIVATDLSATVSHTDFDFKYKTALIIGNEEKGVSPSLKKKADHLIRIVHSPKAESLNVSAATAVLLFEALRQRV